MSNVVWCNIDTTLWYEIQQRRCRLCGTCGAVVAYGQHEQHENFHLTFSNRIGADMANVKWCDPGDHAFKAGEPGSATFQGTVIDEHGMAQTVNNDACAEHNPYGNPTLKENAERRRLTKEAEHELNTLD